MRLVRFILALAAAALAHIVGSRLIPGFVMAVDLFLVVVVFQALEGNTLAGLVAGLVVGLVQDSLTGSLYGLHGFADTIVGYLTALLAQRVVFQRASGVMLAFLAATLVQQLVLVGLLLVFFTDPELPPVGWVAARAAGAALLGVTVWLAGAQWRSRYEGWRRSRAGRLHFR